MITPIRPKRPGLIQREREAAEAETESRISTYLHKEPDFTRAGERQHERAKTAMDRKRSTQRALERMREALKKSGKGERSEEGIERPFRDKSFKDAPRYQQLEAD